MLALARGPFSVGNAGAQNLIVTLGASLEAPMTVPPEYAAGENLCNLNLSARSSAGSLIWEVFALRDELALYSRPGGGAVVETAKIGDQFFVYQERRGFLLLGAGEKWGELFQGLRFRGWARREDLLLHRMAMKKHGVWRKALMVNAARPSERKKEDAKTAPYYAGPECSGEKLGVIPVFSFLFVYETYPACANAPQAVLVGKKDLLSGREDLLGWVRGDRVTLWDTREAIEINFEPLAMARRQLKETPATIFSDFASAAEYSQSRFPQQVLENVRVADTEDFSQRAWPAEVLRYPVLQKHDGQQSTQATDDIYEIGFTSRPVLFSETAKSHTVAGLQLGLKKQSESATRREAPRYERGFINMYCQALPEPLYKTVVLMSGVDLGALISLVRELAEVPDHEKLAEAWRKILSSASRESGASSSVAQYAEQKLGLTLNSALLKIPLRDIETLNARRARSLLSEIDRKRTQLETILYDDSSNKRWFLMNGSKYYWIRVEELP